MKNVIFVITVFILMIAVISCGGIVQTISSKARLIAANVFCTRKSCFLASIIKPQILKSAA